MTCERCGLDLETLGRWKDFDHYRADSLKRTPCVSDDYLGPETLKAIDDFIDLELVPRLRATLDRISE